MDPCPGFLALSAAEGSPRREQVLAHAADCDACREALAELAAVDGESEVAPASRRAVLAALARPRRPWLPAAAALLLGVGIWRWQAPREPVPALAPTRIQVPSPVFSQLSKEGLLQASDSEVSLILGKAGALTLKPGSRVRVQGAEATLIEGALWAETPGELLRLRAAGALVEMENGTVLLEARTPTPVSWLSEALAEEAGARLVVLSGSARVSGREIRAGQEATLGPSGAGEPRAAAPLAWRGDRGWRRLDGLPLRLEAGEHALGPPEPRVWEAVFRRLQPSVSVAVCFVAGGKGRQVPLGAAWLDGKAPIRVRLETKDGWVRLVAGPYELLRKPVGALEGLDPATPACGLRILGGEVEVIESRWKEMP